MTLKGLNLTDFKPTDFENVWSADSSRTVESIEEHCCGARFPITYGYYYCTRTKHHSGHHAAHAGQSDDSKLVAVWTEKSGDPELAVDEGL